jgi:hypothetical protein
VLKIVHDPWLPTNTGGIGRRQQYIAIVGYSHYVKSRDVDCKSLTNDLVRDVISGKRRLAFFTKVQSYFGFDNPKDFWPRVLFFNFLPGCIGKSKDKYGNGSDNQHSLAKDRVLRILAREKPDKVFVFTTKGWQNFPKTTENVGEQPCYPLFPDSPEPSWGTYEVGSHRVLVCGFRHPQYANGPEMARQVQAFLAFR